MPKGAFQKKKITSDIISGKELLQVRPDDGRVREEGIRINIEVSLLYLDKWFSRIGAVEIHDIMEDAATAEISRSHRDEVAAH